MDNTKQTDSQSPGPRNWKQRTLLLAIVLAVMIAAAMLVPLGPKDSNDYSSTARKIQLLRQQIEMYCGQTGDLPASLKNLWAVSGEPVDAVDAWGEMIIYQAAADGGVTLTSYAKDQAPGGKGVNKDLIMHFLPSCKPASSRPASRAS